MHGILKITIYFILNIKMLNELNHEEVMNFLQERGYNVVELEWYTKRQFIVEHDWVCILSGDWDLVFWFLLWVYYLLSD